MRSRDRRFRLIAPILVAASAASAALGCGAGAGPGAASPSTDAGAESDAAQDAGTDAPSSFDAPADAVTDAVADGGTTDASDGSAADMRLWPLAVGRSWTYCVTMVGAGSACPAGMQVETILSQTPVDGRNAFQDRSWCSVAGTTNLSQSGEEVDLDYQTTWIVVLGVPVQEGQTWTSTGAINYTWHDAGSVTVPAGTFSSCWNRTQNVAYTAYTIFCRGVGVVRDYSKDLNGNGWDAQLASKSF